MAESQGRFVPGSSGNPRGRPPKGTYGLGEAELRKLLKKTAKVSDEAVDIVIKAMRDGKTIETQLSCAKWLIEKVVQLQKELDVKLNKGRPDNEADTEEDGAAKEARKPVTLKLTM